MTTVKQMIPPSRDVQNTMTIKDPTAICASVTEATFLALNTREHYRVPALGLYTSISP